MPYAKIDSAGFILEVTRNGEADAIEIPEDIMSEICQSKYGHSVFRFTDSGFVFDDSFYKDSSKAQAIEITKVAKANREGAIAFDANPNEVGFFGNIWIRKLHFLTKDTVYEGHSHDHDHVSLLLSGSVLVEVEGFTPKIFKAATYIIIKAEHHHKITALEDDTLWWCLHARRDEGGEVVEIYGEENSPYGD